MTPETGSPDTYTYDANGNMTCRVEGGVTFKQTYSAENRISTIQKLASGTCASPGNLTAHWAFAYDGDGTRVSTLYTPYVGGAPQTSVLTAYYMGGAYEVKDSAVKKYYSIAGMMVATQDASGLQYLLTDHLGSTVAVTNSSGTLTSQQRYLPFGAERAIPNSPILSTDFGYTGQRLLDSGMGGIMDYKARFYSPYLNHFTQPDTIIPDQTNPQSWNRYSYVYNNPIRYNDPTGHCACLVLIPIAELALIALIGLVAYIAIIDLQSVEMAKGYGRDKKLEQLDTLLSSTSPENIKWSEDPDPGSICSGPTGIVVCIGLLIITVGAAILCGNFCDEWVDPDNHQVEEPQLTTTSSPISTATPMQMEEPQLTPTSSPISTATPTNTPTQIPTPTFSPLPRFRRNTINLYVE